jgi:1-acyl-sn-glycerol-3-phosphate acyltransferase
MFKRYARRFVSRHFHAVRLAGEFSVQKDLPVVVYINHASWWDPMMMMLLSDELLPGRHHFAPVDSEAIERYKMFKRLGFFGVQKNSRSGARDFLRVASRILESPQNVLWITPQGRFADARERPARFQRGLGKLAARCRAAVFVPLAMEYTFWEERLPEALVWIGQPTLVERVPELNDRSLSEVFEANLMQAQDDLASAAVRRETDPFVTKLSGQSGVNGIYDGWRSLAARLRGRSFTRKHGSH